MSTAEPTTTTYQTRTTKNGQTVAVVDPAAVEVGDTIQTDAGPFTVAALGRTFGTPATCYAYAEAIDTARTSRNRGRSSRRVTTYRTNSGWTGTRNARGRCEDAPCCGCCTY